MFNNKFILVRSKIKSLDAIKQPFDLRFKIITATLMFIRVQYSFSWSHVELDSFNCTHLYNEYKIRILDFENMSAKICQLKMSYYNKLLWKTFLQTFRRNASESYVFTAFIGGSACSLVWLFSLYIYIIFIWIDVYFYEITFLY